MATLNVKNLSDKLYRKLRTRAERHHRSAAQEVIQILTDALEEPEPLSITELRGLGKELWEGKTAAEHVAEERKSWD